MSYHVSCTHGYPYPQHQVFYQSLIAFKIGPLLLFNLQTFDGFKVLTFCQVSTWYPQRIANQLLGVRILSIFKVLVLWSYL